MRKPGDGNRAYNDFLHMAHILAIRLSSLGDVAMAVPVVYSLAVSRPHDEVTVVSRRQWKALFLGMPANVRFCGIDPASCRSLRGLERLFRELMELKPDCVADLHDVLRTKYLRLRFRMSCIHTEAIRKGRREKRGLTRRKNKRLHQLKTSTQRYEDVFRRLGFPAESRPGLTFRWDEEGAGGLDGLMGAKNGDEWVGIAPFARHKGKVYPPELMEQTISLLCRRSKRRIFVFGEGEAEKATADKWAGRYPAVISLIGRGKLEDELAALGRMDAVLSMDSANMHLASLTGTAVVSIWGATHPFAGFCVRGRGGISVIQSDMDCRPCSVFGDKPCMRGDYACLTRISPHDVAERIEATLEKRKLTETI